MNKFNHNFPYYEDDSDYNTNANSYYKDLGRKTKLIKLLAKRIWEYDERLENRLEELEIVLNDYLSQWDKRIDGLDEEVSHIFVEWLNDGTLEQIINHDVLGNKADKTYVDEFNQEVTTELAQTAKQEYLLYNMKELGAESTGQSDVGSILKEIIDNQPSGIIFFPKGTYFIDMDIERTIGTGYNQKHFTFLGEGNSTKLLMNTYTGNRNTSFEVNLSLDNLWLDGMCGDNEVNNILASYLSIVGGNITNCKITDFNSSIYLGRTGTMRIENNTFGLVTDHALYYRNNEVDADRQNVNIIIRGNEFVGTNNVADYDDPSVSNPRHAIKITGQLESVVIDDNLFKGYGGNITITPGDLPANQIVKKLLVKNNTFFTAYSSIEYAGLREDSFDFSDQHIIKDNEFVNSDRLNFGAGDFGSIAHIYCRASGYVNLQIKGNNFKGKLALVSSELTTRTNTFVFEGNVFDGSRLGSIRSAKTSILSNTVKNMVGAFVSMPVIQDFVFSDNVCVDNEAEIFHLTSGYNTTPIFIKNNKFIKCSSVFVGRDYALGCVWEGNLFVSCDEIFKRHGENTSLDSTSSFSLKNNELVDTSFSLNESIRNNAKLHNATVDETTGFKVGDDRPTQWNIRKEGTCFFDTTLNKPIWYTGTSWVDANGESV